MGIYIFNWSILRKYLVEDQAKTRHLEDFGKHVIPAFLKNGENIFAYSFHDYWKDVGTIESLWEANMDFINPNHELNIRDQLWRIYTKSMALPPQFITNKAVVNYSMLVDGCYVAGEVYHSILSKDVKVGEGSKISHSVIMAGTTIGKNVEVSYAIIGENAYIADNAKVIGTPDAIEVIGYSEVIGGLKDEEA